MRKALIIAVVVVMLVTGIPILSMGSCHDCGAAMVTGGPCTAATLLLFGLFIAMLFTFIRPPRFLCVLEPVYARLDRPPVCCPPVLYDGEHDSYHGSASGSASRLHCAELT